MKLLFIFIIVFNIVVVAQDIQTDAIEDDSELLDSFEEEFEQSSSDDNDPLKEYNIMMTNYNDIFYTKIFFPLADEYKTILPKSARVCVSNFFDNLKYPIRLTNNLAQLKFKNSLDETKRFLLNSTIGIAGLFDIARTSYNIKRHNEDLGQTLGFYGIGGGYHLVLPFIGPSNIRDAVSIFLDATYFDPVYYYFNLEDALVIKTGYYINEASFHAKEYNSIKRDSVDLYPHLKDLYEQYRKSEIKK